MSDAFAESKFEAKIVNTVKSKTQQVRVFKINRILGKINHSNEYKTFKNKLIKKPWKIKNMNGVQNI